MKSKGLLSILTFSEKRKDILFLLEEKSCTLSDIKDYFNVSSPEISPRIKEMLEHNLIEKTDKDYQITPIGKAIIHHFRPFLDIIETIEKNESFWEEHYLDDIPQHLLNDLIALKECNVVSGSIENIYESHKIFVENLLKSSTIEHREKLEFYLNASKTELYVIDDVKLAFVVSDMFFSMSLFFNPDTYDPRDDLVGYDKSAIKWGSDLFDYYRNKSRKVTSI
ncbi:MAG: hypothetical protein PWQ50_503 [Methanolobus sp.]|nr:hypothetical protein [Methanolobus sp.]